MHLKWLYHESKLRFSSGSQKLCSIVYALDDIQEMEHSLYFPSGLRAGVQNRWQIPDVDYKGFSWEIQNEDSNSANDR